MITRRPLVCPVLVGRDDLLDLADRRIAEVRAGGGRFLLLAGEAGIGKTRLLGAIEGQARAAGFRVVRGGTYPSDRHVQGAILLDLARWLARSSEPDLVAAGTALEGIARSAPPGVPVADSGDGRSVAAVTRQAAGDAHRRRRIMTLDAAETLVGLGASGAVLIELEDLHWSDDLTLQVLEAVAGRIAETPILIIGTYRSDELFPRVPMREWRGRLTGRRLAEEIRLARLTEADTAIMISALLGSDLPAARDLVAVIQARSDGIPLHVEEILALQRDVPTAGRDDLRPTGLPASVEDAIVVRLESRSADAVAVARAGAVIGRSCDLGMIAAVTGRPPEALAAPLVELSDHFILLPARVPGRYAFRHALICDVIYEHIPEPERRRLHDRTAEAAAVRPDIGVDAYLAIQYEGAGRAEDAFRSAMAGAHAASAMSSHREALGLYDVALRTAPADLAPGDRADLLAAYATTAAATDDNVGADPAFAAARAAYLDAGDVVGAATILAAHVAVRHLLGDDLETREAMLRVGLDELDALEAAGRAAGSLDRPRAVLLAAMAAADMLARRLDASIVVGTEARRLAARAGDATVERHAATTLGSCFVFAGRMDDGWGLLASAVQEARAAHREADASRAYRMIGSSASVLVEYERAERWLRDGIDHAEVAETWNDRHYMAAHLAHVLWATGRWDAARDLARHALADGRGGITTRITALHTLGYVAMGRGELVVAREHLDEARLLGERMRELQRLSPALWGLAEVALAAGDLATAADLVERAAAASAAVEDAAYLFPFAITGTRVYLALGDPGRARDWLDRVAGPIERRGIPGTLPGIDHGRGLLAAAEGATGLARTLLVAASAGWHDRRRVWEGAWAQLDLARCHVRSNQHAEAVRVAAAARDLAMTLPAPAIVAGAEEIIGRRRVVDRDGWAPLSAREFEVARLVSRGRTNPEIAAQLRISRKTVSAHVEHILAKLGVDRRAEIAAWVAARPVLHSRPHGDDREE